MNLRLILSSRLQMTALSLVVAGIVGCSREEQSITVRNVPKQPEPTTRGSLIEPMAMQAQMPAGMGGAAMPPAGNQSGGSIEWVLPDGWKELPGDGGMRFATIVVDPANPTIVLTVIPLNGDSGGVLANVNRWRNQIAMQPIVEADLAKNITEFEIAGAKSYSVNITGPETANPRMAMLAAGIPYKGQTWFLKLAGPANVVSPQKDKFQAFVKSVKFGNAAAPKPAAAPQGQPEMPAGHPAIPGAAPQGQPEMPAGHPAIPGAAPAGQPEVPAGHPAIPGVAAPGAAAATSVPFKFEVPAGWVKDEPMPMRTVSFHIGDGASKVDLIVSQLPTMGSGGVVDNVNRWRGQVGLAALPAGQPPVSQPIKVGGADGQQFDFVGPGAAAVAKRQVVAWVTRGQDWWFFKLSGTDEQVSKQLTGFNSFLKSVQFIATTDAAAKP